MKRKLLISFLILFALASVFVLTIALTSDKPPVQEMDDARNILAIAGKEKKLPAAEEMFSDAQQLYDSALLSWKKENKKVFFLRDFSSARTFAGQSVRMSQLSIETAKSEVLNIDEVLSVKKKELLKQVELYDNVFSRVPLNKTQRNDWARGNMMLQEGLQAYGNGNYTLAEQKFHLSEKYLNGILHFVKTEVMDYFENYPQWNKWAQKAIDQSRKKKTYALVVDKFSRTGYLYYKGKLYSEYEVEFGPNWIGDKNIQGDKSTPEGEYKITKKKMDGATKYHKALLLNYPNDDDMKRFLNNKKKGHIDQSARIGNLIEVHGHGGKGTDWTDGCVALSDADMDKLYPLCSVGTEVVIVGSLIPFEQLIKQIK